MTNPTKEEKDKITMDAMSTATLVVQELSRHHSDPEKMAIQSFIEGMRYGMKVLMQTGEDHE